MSSKPKHFYEFGPFRVDVGEGFLLREGEVVPLTRKAFELLIGVSGVGPKVALALLSMMDAATLYKALADEDQIEVRDDFSHLYGDDLRRLVREEVRRLGWNARRLLELRILEDFFGSSLQATNLFQKLLWRQGMTGRRAIGFGGRRVARYEQVVGALGSLLAKRPHELEGHQSPHAVPEEGERHVEVRA